MVQLTWNIEISLVALLIYFYKTNIEGLFLVILSLDYYWCTTTGAPDIFHNDCMDGVTIIEGWAFFYCDCEAGFMITKVSFFMHFDRVAHSHNYEEKLSGSQH